jgi:predicted outer membrane repeat protein
MGQCVFEQNTAGQSGGAICNSTFGTTLIDGCTIKNNTAGIEGSAIASSAATMAILTGSTMTFL